MFETTLEIALLLIAVGFLAGFVDAIAGGGGLIVVPALLLAGPDPITALATNKLQAVFGSGTAALSYARAGHVRFRDHWLAALMAGIASVGGALLAKSLPVDWLRMGLPVVLVGVALFFALKPGLDDGDRAQRLTPLVFSLTFVPLIGFYDGILGPGAGSFYMLGFVLLAGFGVLRATAHTKLLNFASNIGALVTLLIVAKPWWVIGLSMGLAQALGARLGARVAMRVGARMIKPLLVLTSTALALRLIWQMWL